MDGLKLINADFPFEFAGISYLVKKANLEKVILFQTRFNQLSEAKDPALESKTAQYCLYLILKDVRPETTEAWVGQNAPLVELVDVVEQFGFMNQQKVALLRAMTQRNALEQKTPQDGTSSTQP